LYQFRILPSDYPFPAEFTSGVEFETVIVNPEVYPPWMKSELDSRGVRFVRRRVSSLDEACELAGKSGAVINATGLGELHSNSEGRRTHEHLNLGARSLFGVEDTKMYPVRGQTMIVYSPNVKECITVVRGGEQLFTSPDGLGL
jgi:hypothetical protein